MKLMRYITGAVAGVLLMVVVPFSASASSFDAAYYAAKYPDVVAVFGTDEKAMYNHYLKYGIKEGRFANAEEEAAGHKELPYQTYIDVDLEEQLLIYYENGKARLVSQCVTGDVSKERATPVGTFSIKAKEESRYLTGPDWKSWVDRWMPFKGGYGIHDASWRREFGGEIYKTGGSHGCVNLPHDVALELYDLVGVGTIVVVH